VVTRNSYGCLVLNTRDLAFVDADIPRPQPKLADMLPGFLKRLFGGSKTEEGPAPLSPEQQVLEKIRRWSNQHPEIGMRLYRTAAGFRGVITNRAIDAATAEADGLLSALPTDPLYRRLCRSQECYRARLTPKPWRIQLPPPAERFPWPNAAAEQAFRNWQRTYDRAAERFATCQWIDQLGPDEVLPEPAPLLKLHDTLSRSESDAPLA